jgi:hypothetical protein
VPFIEFAGDGIATVNGARWDMMRKTRRLAGSVALAFLETV